MYMYSDTVLNLTQPNLLFKLSLYWIGLSPVDFMMKQKLLTSNNLSSVSLWSISTNYCIEIWGAQPKSEIWHCMILALYSM